MTAAPPSSVPSGSTSVPVEAPSGKDAEYENFPVGSVLLPARLRPHVARFYAFARAIDDIADSPDLSPDEKGIRLEGFEAAITGRETGDPAYAKAHAMRESLAETKVSHRHCVDLITAFKRDAVKNRTRDWADLMDYCLLSAAPVGRYLIDLHGGSRAGYATSDALCNALQVINHLQDCQDDYRTLNRVYLPEDWLAEEGTSVEALDGGVCTPALRRVMDRCLTGTRALMDEALGLPGDILDRRLGLEAAVIVEIALALTDKLARLDPLANRVKLSKGEAGLCAAKGILRGVFRPSGGRRAVRAKGEGR
ncbi:MAG: squalene synthase HpnC [Rhodospirillum sp.]|nr:squalene synthase HpnC [Rhodospirillum sp.]MCF8489550.1 squalene synthase HpnC [Rhodospirillum sp.]MCF8499739.1 squalene synthase HpnC [Rhodospirillum sp.]